MLKDKLKSSSFLRTLALKFRSWSAKRSYSSGHGNVVHNQGVKVDTRIQIIGNNNRVVIESCAVVKDCLIKISGSDNTVRIGRNAYLSGAELWIEDNGCKITIGSNTFIGHHSHLACTENGRQLSVGTDCLLSSYVQIRTGDSHSILNMDDKRINPASDVVISDHCWIGQGARILKGSFLYPETVVATGAIVHGMFRPNVILAGNPAKVVKEKIKWSHERI